jgi:hypothetical protein
MPGEVSRSYKGPTDRPKPMPEWPEPCLEPCALGDLGHCGRTDRERRSHCEKRFNAGLPQLSNTVITGNGNAPNNT